MSLQIFDLHKRATKNNFFLISFTFSSSYNHLLNNACVLQVVLIDTPGKLSLYWARDNFQFCGGSSIASVVEQPYSTFTWCELGPLIIIALRVYSTNKYLGTFSDIYLKVFGVVEYLLSVSYHHRIVTEQNCLYAWWE